MNEGQVLETKTRSSPHILIERDMERPILDPDLETPGTATNVSFKDCLSQSGSFDNAKFNNSRQLRFPWFVISEDFFFSSVRYEPVSFNAWSRRNGWSRPINSKLALTSIIAINANNLSRWSDYIFCIFK
jgi:hypothetical protein